MPIQKLKTILIVVVILYVLIPWDVIPDRFGPVGRIDDLAVLAYVLRYYLAKKSAAKHAGATQAQNAGSGKSQKFQPEPEDPQVFDPYQILGLERGATQAEIIAAYKREAAKYHPDKVSHLGQELQTLAHERMLLISRAYNELLD